VGYIDHQSNVNAHQREVCIQQHSHGSTIMIVRSSCHVSLVQGAEEEMREVEAGGGEEDEDDDEMVMAGEEAGIPVVEFIPVPLKEVGKRLVQAGLRLSWAARASVCTLKAHKLSRCASRHSACGRKGNILLSSPPVLRVQHSMCAVSSWLVFAILSYCITPYSPAC
jgi:hypothetical protein